MIHQLVSIFFRRRHFWRDASFDEIAELYVSRLLTMFAHNAVVLFAAVYMYKLGYSLAFIAAFYVIVYAVKIPFAHLAGLCTAWAGPKHTILISNLLRIPALAAFAMVEQWGLVSIATFGVLHGIAVAWYNIGYAVDFSKVRDLSHLGKEIGIMQIIEKVAKIVSPLIGGLLAAMVSPALTVAIACVIFAFATWPLLRSVEPTQPRQRLRYRALTWRLIWRTLLAQWSAGVDFVTSGVIWTMFIATVIFASTGQAVYAALGGLASLGVFISIIVSYTFGRIIDRRGTTGLLVFGAWSNIIIHLFRPFVITPAGVVGANVGSEATTSAYSMALMRVMFDAADQTGARIAYLTLCEIMMDLGALVMMILWYFALHQFGDDASFAAMFVAASVGLLPLLAARHFARRRRQGILKRAIKGGARS